MANLQSFGVAEMMAVRSEIRGAFNARTAESFEDAAQTLAQLLRATLTTPSGDPACALVRVFKTHLFSELDDDLKTWVLQRTPNADANPALRCLVLMGTDGVEPAWQTRHRSVGHKAIPMASAEAVAQAPMVSQLIRQLGFDLQSVIRPNDLRLPAAVNRTDGVFHVLDAVGSADIPSQADFVIPYGVKSVLGFGGMLTSGDLVAAILFSTVTITSSVAEQFRIIGLNFKLAVLPYALKPTFALPSA